jgi:hypothetical protein
VKRAIALAAAVTSLVCVANQAGAACRTTTCDRLEAPPECNMIENGCNTAGTPVAWPSSCVSTSVSSLGSPLRGVSAEQMRDIVNSAFQQWTNVDCGGGKHPSFVVDMFPDVSCTDVKGKHEYNRAGPNYNLWMFQDDGWDFDDIDAESAIAITDVQFDPFTGEIHNANVFLNSFAKNFTTDPNNADFDLPSVVQHESGHFLGLAHSPVRMSTMWPYSFETDTSLRTLDPDDVLGMCAAYPPGNLDPTCDPEPRHGFSTTCELAKSSCSLAPARGASRHNAGFVVIAGAMLAAIGYRRRWSRS